MPSDSTSGRRDARVEKIANYDRLMAMGDAVNRRNAGPGRRRPPQRPNWWRRSLIAVGVVIVLVVGGVVADYFYLGSLVHHVTVNNLQKSTAASENILLIGSTTRCGLKQQNVAYGLCSQGVTGVNSDIDMILHLDPATRTVSLLSIPRDTFVPNARIIGANKIDAALYEGPSQLTTAIEEDFGIPIDNFVELNFDTFANVVNALGGVKMYFPVPIYDADSDLNIERAGCYDLNGFHALQLVRARHLQIQPTPSNHDPRSWPYEALSDIARIRRTHEFLRVLAAKVAARGLSNPLTDQGIMTAVLPSLTVDSGFTEGKMVSLAESFAHTSIANVPQFTYPVSDVESGSLMYQGYPYGDVVFPIEPNGATGRQLDPRGEAGNELLHRRRPSVTLQREGHGGERDGHHQSGGRRSPTHFTTEDLMCCPPVTSPPTAQWTRPWSGTEDRRRPKVATGRVPASRPPRRSSINWRVRPSSGTTRTKSLPAPRSPSRPATHSPWFPSRHHQRPPPLLTPRRRSTVTRRRPPRRRPPRPPCTTHRECATTPTSPPRTR